MKEYFNLDSTTPSFSNEMILENLAWEYFSFIASKALFQVETVSCYGFHKHLRATILTHIQIELSS